MSAFPDFLFKLTPRDEQGVPLEVFFKVLDAPAGAGTTLLTDPYEVPAGKLLCLTGVGLVASGDAIAQRPLHAMLNLYDASGVNQTIYGQNYGTLVATALGSVITVSGHFNNIIIPQGVSLAAQAEFLTGNVGNAFSCTLYGVLIPRGNFAI